MHHAGAVQTRAPWGCRGAVYLTQEVRPGGQLGPAQSHSQGPQMLCPGVVPGQELPCKDGDALTSKALRMQCCALLSSLSVG